jgi:hypothetical protein
LAGLVRPVDPEDSAAAFRDSVGSQVVEHRSDRGGRLVAADRLAEDDRLVAECRPIDQGSDDRLALGDSDSVDWALAQADRPVADDHPNWSLGRAEDDHPKAAYSVDRPGPVKAYSVARRDSAVDRDWVARRLAAVAADCLVEVYCLGVVHCLDPVHCLGAADCPDLAERRPWGSPEVSADCPAMPIHSQQVLQRAMSPPATSRKPLSVAIVMLLWLAIRLGPTPPAPGAWTGRWPPEVRDQNSVSSENSYQRLLSLHAVNWSADPADLPAE